MNKGKSIFLVLASCFLMVLIGSASRADAATYYFDGDMDGYGSDTAPTSTTPSLFYSATVTGDCDDNDEDIYPGATETAGDGVDSDCDGEDNPVWYLDSDGDGYGDPNTSQVAAAQPTGYVLDNTDCHDAAASINPGATDIAGDGIDQDCDGKDSATWYKDADLDGYGDPNTSQDAATKPVGYVANNADCDDTDAGIYPGADDIPGDNIDQDCNGADAATTFSGIVTSDVDSGLAPVTITFYTLIAEGSSPFTFAYDFGDGTTKTGATKTESHEYTSAGTYTAKVTVTDAAGTSYQVEKEVVISDTATVSANQDLLQTDADQMGAAADGDEVTGLLQDAANLVDDVLKAISNADGTTKNQIQGAVQSKVEDLVKNTNTILTDLVKNNKVSISDISGIAQSLNEVVSNMVKNDLPVTGDTLDNLGSISGIFYEQTLDTVLQGQNLTQAEIDELKTDTAKAQAYFQNNPQLLDDVAGASGIPVNTAKPFDAGDIDTVAGEQGLTDAQAGLLYKAIEKTLNVELKISSSTTTVTVKTIAEIASEIYDTYYGKTVVDLTVQDITGNILLKFSDNTYVSFLILSVNVANGFMPPGLFDLPNGNKMGVTDTYAMEFVSYPVFATGFIANTIQLGLTPTLTQNGGLQVAVDASTTLSLKMGWDYLLQNSLNGLTTSFSVVGGSDPSAEAYSLLVTYDNGAGQLMPPSVYALDALTTWLDSTISGDYSIDVDTGVVTVSTLNLKPDYMFQNLTSINYTEIVAAGGVQFGTLAFDVSDVNGDGVPDIIFYADDPMGSQTLYTLP